MRAPQFAIWHQVQTPLSVDFSTICSHFPVQTCRDSSHKGHGAPPSPQNPNPPLLAFLPAAWSSPFPEDGPSPGRGAASAPSRCGKPGEWGNADFCQDFAPHWSNPSPSVSREGRAARSQNIQWVKARVCQPGPRQS